MKVYKKEVEEIEEDGMEHWREGRQLRLDTNAEVLLNDSTLEDLLENLMEEYSYGLGNSSEQAHIKDPPTIYK